MESENEIKVTPVAQKEVKKSVELVKTEVKGNFRKSSLYPESGSHHY